MRCLLTVTVAVVLSGNLRATTIIVLPTKTEVILAVDSLRTRKDSLGLAVSTSFGCKLVVTGRAAYALSGGTGTVVDPFAVHKMVASSVDDDLDRSMVAVAPVVTGFLDRMMPSVANPVSYFRGLGRPITKLIGVGLAPDPTVRATQFYLGTSASESLPVGLSELAPVKDSTVSEDQFWSLLPDDWLTRPNLVPTILAMMQVAVERDPGTGGEISVVRITRQKGLEWAQRGACKAA
jgi:hypothetical protein